MIKNARASLSFSPHDLIPFANILLLLYLPVLRYDCLFYVFFFSGFFSTCSLGSGNYLSAFITPCWLFVLYSGRDLASSLDESRSGRQEAGTTLYTHYTHYTKILYINNLCSHLAAAAAGAPPSPSMLSQLLQSLKPV